MARRKRSGAAERDTQPAQRSKESFSHKKGNPAKVAGFHLKSAKKRSAKS